jgi:hypothetical protein
MAESCIVNPDINDSEAEKRLSMQQKQPFSAAHIRCDAPNPISVPGKPFESHVSGNACAPVHHNPASLLKKLLCKPETYASGTAGNYDTGFGHAGRVFYH